MKCTLRFLFILTFSSSAMAQKTLPYIANFDNTAEQNEWKQYRLGQAKDPNYLWQFEKANSITDSFALVHYYPVGGSQTTDDWMVSPELDMTKGAIIDSLYHLMTGFGTPQTADTVALYYLEGNRDPSMATRKEIVHDFLRTDFKSDNTWYSKSALKIPYKAKSGYLAFRYKTVVNWFDVRVDNIQVAPQKTVGKNAYINAGNVQIFPNPTSDFITIETNAQVPVFIKIIDVSGAIRLQESVMSGTELPLNFLAAGVYFVESEIIGKTSVQKLVIQ